MLDGYAIQYVFGAGMELAFEAAQKIGEKYRSLEWNRFGYAATSMVVSLSSCVYAAGA
jgi:hypothetical protein